MPIGEGEIADPGELADHCLANENYWLSDYDHDDGHPIRSSWRFK